MKSKKDIETNTSESLKAVPFSGKEESVESLLKVLYTLGMEGNVTAAKLYLDHCFKNRPAETKGLTAEAAIRLLQDQDRDEG